MLQSRGAVSEAGSDNLHNSSPTAQVDPVFVLPRNLSHCEESFHLKHFAPRESWLKHHGKLPADPVPGYSQRKACKQRVPQSPPPPLSPQPVGSVLPVSTPHAVGGPLKPLVMADSKPSCKQQPLSDDHEVKTSKASRGIAEELTLITTRAEDTAYLSDTDTNFSEDYTQMTEVGSGSDLGGRTPPGSFDGLDSPSVGSEGSWSTTSTLSEHGFLENSPEDEIANTKKANIRLLLGQPSEDSENGEEDCATSPVDEEQSPEYSIASTLTPSDSNNALFEDREFDFLKAEPVRRSTSLKTYKTPPGTPSRKKAVRFADALGLDLESVRHILNLEDPPVVPKSAMRDLKVGLEEEHRTEGSKYLAAYFPQPSADPGFHARVQANKIVLENCLVDDKDMTVSGTCRVANIGFHKKVIIRYTINNWLTYEDVCASYIQNSNDGPTDRFSFTINVPKYFSVGSRLGFALMYHVNGMTYWDNNRGTNYIVECYAKSVPTHASDSAWMHFL